MNKFIVLFCTIFLTSCASTSSVLLSPQTEGAKVAILQLEGPMGDQASDFISKEFAEEGIYLASKSRSISTIAVDTDIGVNTPETMVKFANYGKNLGVDFILVGTVSTVGGPLYSFDHVNITLNLIDVKTGQTRWIGRYGNSMWTSAISQQGDLQRGAKHIVREFIKAGGKSIINNP